MGVVIFESSLSETTSPLRAFTLIGGWESDSSNLAPASVIVTEPFRIVQGPWAIVWSLVGEMLRVGIHRAEGQAEPHQHEAVNVRKSGKGIAYVDKPGTFYLTIETLGHWIVKTVSVEEVGALP